MRLEPIDLLEAKMLIAAGGFEIKAEPNLPGHYYWWHVDSATGSEPFSTRKDALVDCSKMVVSQAMDDNQLSPSMWHCMSVRQKALLIREVYVVDGGVGMASVVTLGGLAHGR